MLVVQNFTAINQVLLKFQGYVGQSTNQYADHLVSFSLIAPLFKNGLIWLTWSQIKNYI